MHTRGIEHGTVALWNAHSAFGLNSAHYCSAVKCTPLLHSVKRTLLWRCKVWRVDTKSHSTVDTTVALCRVTIIVALSRVPITL